MKYAAYRNCNLIDNESEEYVGICIDACRQGPNYGD